MGRGSPRPLPGPSHLSISGFALGSGFAPNSRALRAPIRALPQFLGASGPRLRLRLQFSGVISGASRPRFGLCPQFTPSEILIWLRLWGRGLGGNTGRINGTGMVIIFIPAPSCFFPIRALGIIMPTVVEPSTRLQPSIKLHAPISAFVFSCFGTQCLTPEGWRLR